jgi:subtilisin family serine protease
MDKARSFTPISGAAVPDLSVYYHVTPGPDMSLGELAESLLGEESVAGAYVRPPAALPAKAAEVWQFNLNPAAPPQPPAAPPGKPDFTGRQNYLGPAPEGIDAKYAWNLPGGTGAGIEILDLEWGWRFTHEDLGVCQSGVVAGDRSDDVDLENHGTAVIGILSGDHNQYGINGICPDALVGGVSLISMSPVTAIWVAANHLRPGDIMLLEMHFPGPNSIVDGVPFRENKEQLGYIPIEWWEDGLNVIRYAVSRGIIVVSAAGNGRENLDSASYDTFRGFTNSWMNPFNSDNPNSGAIMVGAGNPPNGTHGRIHTLHKIYGEHEDYEDRARCEFSNYGERIDAQGWGWEVTTTGYGDTSQGTDRDKWYTDGFCGTSSAAPIVAGALACVQGILLNEEGMNLLSPAAARMVLRDTGSPQVDADRRPAGQRIGNRPNLRELINLARTPGIQAMGISRELRKPKDRRRDVLLSIPGHCCQVTEIIIRVGPPEAVQTLSGGGSPPCVPCLPCCPPSLIPSAALKADIPLDSQNRELVQRIQEVTKDTPEELMRKLAREIAARELSEEIRRLARRLGII